VPKIMPRHLVGPMRRRLRLPVEDFGIGPGEAGAIVQRVELGNAPEINNQAHINHGIITSSGISTTI
jgi:predicted glycoside hydrolase/deacetylase ChbG (UPF0249 family)